MFTLLCSIRVPPGPGSRLMLDSHCFMETGMPCLLRNSLYPAARQGASKGGVAGCWFGSITPQANASTLGFLRDLFRRPPVTLDGAEDDAAAGDVGSVHAPVIWLAGSRGLVSLPVDGGEDPERRMCRTCRRRRFRKERRSERQSQKYPRTSHFAPPRQSDSSESNPATPWPGALRRGEIGQRHPNRQGKKKHPGPTPAAPRRPSSDVPLRRLLYLIRSTESH